MIVPVSSTTRLVFVVAAVFLAAALSFLSVRNARAVHYADRATLPGYVKAVQLEPKNARNGYHLGRYWQYNLEQPDAQRAIGAYRTSLALDPHAREAWLDLATSYELEGNIPSARESFLQAKKAYPLSAEIRQAVYVDPRRGGETPGSRIRGSAWVDDVALVPERAEQPRP
jgi:tetratricopeptide (TPR) repeat protein